MRHWAKSSLQMWLGRVFRYCFMLEGSVPLEQMQVYLRLACTGTCVS